MPMVIFTMEDIKQLQYLFKLKEVTRSGKVGERAESTAEHVWSTMLLAQYFMNRFDLDLDRLKVFEIALYHDVVEIESLDTFILDDEAKKTQEDREKEAIEKIKQTMPEGLSDYADIVDEFEGLESDEAKFVRAVDAIEPMIHWLDYKEDWTEFGFTEENLRKWKEKRVAVFPDLLNFFNNLIEYLKQEGYIS